MAIMFQSLNLTPALYKQALFPLTQLGTISWEVELNKNQNTPLARMVYLNLADVGDSWHEISSIGKSSSCYISQKASKAFQRARGHNLAASLLKVHTCRIDVHRLGDLPSIVRKASQPVTRGAYIPSDR